MKKLFNLESVVKKATNAKDIKKYLKQVFAILRARGANYRVCDKLAYMLEEVGINCFVYSNSVQDNEIVGVSKSGNTIRYCWNKYFLT